MLAAFFDRFKNALINFIKVYIPIVFKYRFFIIICGLALVLFLVLPGFLLNLFLDKNKINTLIQSLSSESKAVFSFDGIVKGRFSDIIVYNVRISDRFENSNKQPLLTIPELRITPNIFQSIRSQTLVVKKITLHDARWRFSGKDNYLNKEQQDRIINLLNRNVDFNIVLINNIVSVILEKENYERQVWNIAIDRGFIRSEKSKVEIFVHYNDLPWGKGSITFSPDLCKTCGLFHGKYNIHLQNLPLNRLSWFFDSLALNNGFIDIASSVEFTNHGKDDETSILSHIRADDVFVTDMSNHPVLENSRFDLDVKFQNKNELIQSEFSGLWKKTPFKGVFVKHKKSAYPETLAFFLDNRKESAIPLPYGFKLDGLKSFHIDLHEDSEKKVYRILSGSFLTGKGVILDQDNQTILQLPDAAVNLENNKFTANVSLVKNKTDIKFNFSGSILPVNKTIETQIEYGDYRKNQLLSYNGVVFEINETGKIDSENIYWQDIETYYQSIRKIWNKSIKDDQFKGWRPSIFRERDWFQKYLMRTTLDNTLSVNNWRYVEKENHTVPVFGTLTLNNSILDLKLNNDRQNYNMMIDMNSNSPLIRGEYKLLFPKLDGYSGNWFPSGLISKFGEASVDGKFNASGERPSDILTNYNATGSIVLQNTVLVIDDKKTSDVLSKVNLDVRSYGDKYQININGENETATISGYGSFDVEKNGWNIKTTVLKKR
jgi:hypothetical protein